MNTIRKLKTTAAILVLLMPSLVFAEAYTHDGFLLRFQGGYALGSLDFDVGDDHTPDSAYLGSVQIGGAVSPSSILYVGYSFINGTGTQSIPIPAELSPIFNQAINADVNYHIGALSLGTSYYIMPSNFYISTELRFILNASVKAEVKNLSVTIPDGRSLSIDSSAEAIYKGGGSSTGIGLGVGKEWWISDNWGMGLSLFWYRDNLTADKVKRTIKITGLPSFSEEVDDTDDVLSSHWALMVNFTYN